MRGQVPCPTRKLSIGDPIALDDEKIKVEFVVKINFQVTEVDSGVCIGIPNSIVDWIEKRLRLGSKWRSWH